MASLKEYCEKLSTSQLQALLREECEGRGNMTVDVILLICEILSERIPTKPPVIDKIHELCRCYLDE
ncbi:MAG: hypothetical protein UHS47_10605 [Oscillospiraceae bacterium]|nr:hypothetical protein [Oscillospiraceae bacterium]